jgi:hypothetical protein
VKFKNGEMMVMTKVKKLCTKEQLTTIMDLTSRRYTLLFFYMTMGMADEFIAYLKDTRLEKPKDFDLYFSRKNLRYIIWEHYKEEYISQSILYEYGDEMDEEIERLVEQTGENYYNVKEQIFLQYYEAHKDEVKLPSPCAYQFLCPVTSIDHKDDIDDIYLSDIYDGVSLKSPYGRKCEGECTFAKFHSYINKNKDLTIYYCGCDHEEKFDASQKELNELKSWFKEKVDAYYNRPMTKNQADYIYSLLYKFNQNNNTHLELEKFEDKNPTWMDVDFMLCLLKYKDLEHSDVSKDLKDRFYNYFKEEKKKNVLMGM